MNLQLSQQDRTIFRQRERIEELEEEVRQLKIQIRDTLSPVTLFPLSWGLTPTQERLLAALYRAAGSLTHEQCFAAIGSRADDMRSLVAVQISKLREKIKPLGLKVVNRWAIGFEMPPESKAIVSASIAERPAA